MLGDVLESNNTLVGIPLGTVLHDIREYADTRLSRSFG